MDHFSQILFDLGKEIGTELYPDEKRICQLNYDDQLHIQIHHDESKEVLILATFLCEVPAGKYREELFKACLIYNRGFLRKGTLSYCERNNQLTFFHKVATENLSSLKLFEALETFIKEGKVWKEAVENAKSLPVDLPKEGGGSVFGMKK